MLSLRYSNDEIPVFYSINISTVNESPYRRKMLTAFLKSKLISREYFLTQKTPYLFVYNDMKYFIQLSDQLIWRTDTNPYGYCFDAFNLSQRIGSGFFCDVYLSSGTLIPTRRGFRYEFNHDVIKYYPFIWTSDIFNTPYPRSLKLCFFENEISFSRLFNIEVKNPTFFQRSEYVSEAFVTVENCGNSNLQAILEEAEQSVDFFDIGTLLNLFKN